MSDKPPIILICNLDKKEVDEFKTNKPTVYNKFIEVKETSLGYQFYCKRADPTEYIIKNYRKHSIKILLRDQTETLKQANYEQQGDTQYYYIPLKHWSATYYARFLTYTSRKKRKKDQDHVLDQYDSGIRITSEKQNTLKKALLDQKWIYNSNTPGDYLYDTKYCALAAVLEALYLKYVLEPLDVKCKRMEFGSLIPKTEYLKYDYFEPHMHLLFCCNKPKEQLKDLRIRSFLEKDIAQYDQRLKPTYYFHNYNSCSGLWAGIENSNYDSDICFFDSRVKSYRNEQGKITSLERLEAFNRFEVTYIAESETQKALHETLYKNIKAFLKALNISYKAIKAGAWFDQTLDVDKCYTIDFETPLSQDRWLEIGNLSLNDTHYTSCYNVKIKNKLAVNGCSGMGIQRLVYIYLLNHSLNPQVWSNEVKLMFETLIKKKIF